MTLPIVKKPKNSLSINEIAILWSESSKDSKERVIDYLKKLCRSGMPYYDQHNLHDSFKVHRWYKAVFVGPGALLAKLKTENESLNELPSPLTEWLNQEGEPRVNPKVRGDEEISKPQIAKEKAFDRPLKNRKKLKPLQRNRNEGLLLIYELLNAYKVNYLDELLAVRAWGKIVSKEFTCDLIKIPPSTTAGHVVLNGGEKLSKEEFSDKYRRRFE